MRHAARRGRLLAAAAAGLALASAGQAALAADAAADNPAVDEVVVTANKRGPALAQSLPVSITAFNEAKLEQLRVTTLDDVIAQTPGTNFIDNGGPGRGYEVASIRGLSPVGDNTAGVVAQYFDGAPHFVPNYYVYDIGEVSVLRGPQGTLWGSQAIGGLISIQSNRADPSGFHAQLRSDTYGTDDSHGLSERLSGFVNLPIVEDKLAIRIAAENVDERGYIDNAVTGAKDVNGVQDKEWRAQVRFRPTDKLDFTLIYQGNKLNSGASNYFDVDLPGRQSTSPYSQSPAYERADLVNLLGDWDLGFATLSYAGSYFHMNNDYVSYDRGVFGLIPVGKDTVTDVQKSWTHELRLASKPGQRLGWVVGLYYDAWDDNRLETSVEVPDPADPGSVVFGTGFPIFTLGGPNNTDQKAVFGEATYDISDKLQVLVGGRYFHWSVFNDQQTTYFGTNFNQATGTVSGNKGFYKLQLNYKPTSDVTLYALRSEGFRPGGFNPFVGPVLNIPESFISFAPDTLVNYEAGAKTSWLDRRLTVNAALYYMNWQKIQTVVYNSTGTFAFTTNGPDLDAKGGELEVTARDVGLKGLYVSGSYGYTTNHFTEDAVIFPGVGALIHEGDQLRRTPHSTWSFDVGYNFTLMNDVEAFVRANYWHKDATSTKGFDSNDGNIRVPAQDVINAQIGVSKDSWSARLYLDNLTNERPLEQIFPNASNRLQPAIASSIRPRTLGLELTKSF
jgi:outer membrane receptor protein involved in Fe transport